MIRSILDSDTYKFTMQCAVLQQLATKGDPLVAYRFTNRGGNLFTRATYDTILSAVQGELIHAASASIV